MAAQLAGFDQTRVAFEPLNEPQQRCDAADWVVMQNELLRTARIAAPIPHAGRDRRVRQHDRGFERLDPAIICRYQRSLHIPFLRALCVQPSGRAVDDQRADVPLPQRGAMAFGGRVAQATRIAPSTARVAADRLTPDSEKRAIRATIGRVLNEYFDARPDRHFIERHFARVTAWADRHRVERSRILLGEFGALRTDERYVAAAAPDRARYIATCVKHAKPPACRGRSGISSTAWD